LTRAAALAVPVLALAACGGTATSESLEDAAKETAESSSRVELRYESGDGAVRGSISGAFDYAGKRALVTDFEFAGSDTELAMSPQPTEVRLLDGTDYVAYEIDRKTYWVKEASDRSADPLTLLLPIPGAAHDPSDVFSLVLHASDRIENLGMEQVRGEEATHYRASVNLHKLAAEVPVAERDEFLNGVAADASLPVDVWVDADSRLRRIGIRHGIEDFSMFMTFELFDYGIEVEVEPPPADQVITQERLDELTGASSAGLSDEELEDLCREELPKEEAEKICDQTEARE
jgi:hypothetical protein